MATLSLTGGIEEFSWRITGLSKPFTQSNGYTEAGITYNRFTQSSTSIYGVVSKVYPPSTGTSTSTSTKTVSYSPGEYTFWAYTKDSYGTYWPAGSATVVVEENNQITDSGSLSISSKTATSISVRLTRIDKATSYEIIYRSEDGDVDYAYTSSTSYTISGLKPNTTYTINYRGINSSSEGPYMSTGVNVTTEKLITDYGSMTLESVTMNSITVTITPIKNAVSYYILCRNSTSGAEVDITTNKMTNTIQGLLPNTTYVLNYYGIDSYGSTGPYMPTGLTVKTKQSIDPWDWNASNGSATATQTKTAYNAVTQKGKLSDFSYLVWNDIVNKTNTVLAARSLTWDNTYSTKSSTEMSSASKTMTAARFNAVWWNLSRMVKVGLGQNPRAPGEVILGSYFTALTDAINKAIP